MRRLALLPLVAGLAGSFAPAASASVCALPDYVFCTVDCVSQYDIVIDPNGASPVKVIRPSCMDEDA
jgi:hypothetical protein